MAGRARVFFAIYLLVLAPVGAAVVVGVLLLFGVEPHTVFTPGFAVLDLLRSAGFHPPKAVGVLSTVGLWWTILAVAGLLWDRRKRSA